MLLIECPFCGPRDEREFSYGGPDFGRRPDDPGELDDQGWVEQMTVPDNPLGPARERWWHERGCGEWFLLVRDTRTHAVSPDEGKKS